MKLKATRSRRHVSSTIYLIPLVFAASSVGMTAGYGQTAESIEQLINNAKLLPPDYKIRAYVSGPEATIVTYRNAKAIDQDCKIDAILIAQKVMETYKPIAAVRTQFCYLNKPTQYDQVEVHSGDVKAFGSGGQTKQRLLDSLPITKAGPGNLAIDKNEFDIKLAKYQPVPGYGLATRKDILTQLRNIEKYGGDARDYWPSFLAIENKIKAGLTDELVTECNYLSTRVAKGNEATAAAWSRNQIRQKKEHDEITSKVAAANFQPHFGPMYAERLRLAKQIKLHYLAGEDVKAWQEYMIKTVEGYAAANDIPHLQAAVSYLQQQMHLSPLPQ